MIDRKPNESGVTMPRRWPWMMPVFGWSNLIAPSDMVELRHRFNFMPWTACGVLDIPPIRLAKSLTVRWQTGLSGLVEQAAL